jgi:hypothetical protein
MLKVIEDIRQIDVDSTTCRMLTAGMAKTEAIYQLAAAAWILGV